MEITTLIQLGSKGGSILDRIISWRSTRKALKVHAITLLQKAINQTEIYLEVSGGAYLPNQELSNAWIEAFEAIAPIDSDLAIQLRHKSRFWSNPQKWLNEPRALRLIPKLRDLSDRCEYLLTNTLK